MGKFHYIPNLGNKQKIIPSSGHLGDTSE